MWKKITFEEKCLIQKGLNGYKVDDDEFKRIAKKLDYLDIYRILKRLPRIKVNIDIEKLEESLLS